MKTKFRNIILSIFAFIFVGSAFFCGSANTSTLKAEDAFAQTIAVNSVSQKQNASYPVGNLTNNLWLLSFKGEGNPLDSYNLYNNYSQFDLIDQYYNTGDYSLKKYYKTVSNGKLNLSAEILTRNNDGKNIQVITLDKPREYYTEYYYYDYNQGKYIKNEQGYFSHVLLKAAAGKDSYAAAYGEFFPNFVDCQFVANVYNDTYSSIIPKDTDISDKIISYTHAAQLDSQNSTYYLVESSMRSMREYQLICNAFSKISSRMPTSNQDFNSDGKIDCLSVSYFNTNLKNFDVPWSALLWPHMWSVGNGAGAHKELFGATAEDFKNWGYSTTEASLMAGLTWPKLGNLKLGDFFMSDFTLTTNTPETETGWNALISNTSTQIHETGHMLGLPDLYLYNDGMGRNDANTVGKWSQMCYNPENPSLMLSYERQKMGWIDSKNVKQITTSGTYTLSVVKGLDGNNIVSYYLQNPSDSKQKIFLEYRSQNIGLYDSQCGSKSGLLLYYTYSGASVDGNAYAPAYEVLVLKKTGVSVLNAALGQGESFGNSNSAATSDIIFFTSNPSSHTKVNSGIVVTVNNLTANALTFTVQWSKLNGNSYVQSDFENVKLYNKLLSQSSTSALTNSSFKNRTSLDVSDCDITSLDFLWKFNLTNIKYLNLANNKITLLGLTQTQISMLEHMNTIALNNNFIDLNIIPNEYLDLPMLNFGLQRTTTDKYFANKNFAWQYYVKSTDKATTTINGVALSVGRGTYNFTYPNAYDVKTSISVGNFSTNLNYTLTLIKVSTQYNSSANRYKLWTNAGTEDFVAQTILIEGINSNQLIFDYDIDLTQTGDRVTSVGVYINSQTDALCTINVYYTLVQFLPPEVEFVNGDIVYVLVGDQFVDPGIIVREYGNIVDYTYVDNLGTTKNTYTVTIYKANYNSANGTYTKFSQLAGKSIPTTVEANYIIQYTLLDSYGNTTSDYERVVIVVGGLIKADSIDINIYNKLLEYKGSEVLFDDDFENYDFLDLSNINAQSLVGLDQFVFGQDLVLDLSNNKFSNISDLATLMEATNASCLYMFGNQFVREDVVNFATNREKVVFGIQTANNLFVSDQRTDVRGIDFYNDLPRNLMLSTVNNYRIENNMIVFEEYGDLSFKIVEANEILLKVDILNILIETLETNFTKEYSDNFMLNYSDVFAVEGIENSELDITNTVQSQNLTTLGQKQAEVVIEKDDKTLKIIDIKVIVIDTQKPSISLNGAKTVYVKSAQDYYSSYANDICEAADGYDGAISTSKQEPYLSGYGEYTVVYTATDSSGNYETLERKVYIGNVSISNNVENINYNEKYTLPLQTVTFKLSDFTIKYKKSSDSTYQLYNIDQGLKFAEYGNIDINIELVHNKNSNLTYSFIKSVYIQDKMAPTITLVGEYVVDIYSGQVYEEKGYSVSDNAIVGTLTATNKVDGLSMTIEYYKLEGTKETKVAKIDTSAKAKYKIKYIAKDKYNNSKAAERIVNVIYYPIDNVHINTVNLQERYQQGKVVEVSLYVNAPYNTDPNSKVIWYVNGTQLNVTNSMTTSMLFKEAGTYNIQAQVVVGDGYITSDSYEIQIYPSSEFENIAIIICAVIAVAVIGTVAALLIGRYKKRNFY